MTIKTNAPFQIGRLIVACAVVLALVVGCGGAGDPSLDTYAVSGVITDSSGAGIEGVAVSFAGADSPAAVATDEVGHWQKAGLWGEVTVTADDPAYAFVGGTRTVSAAAADVNFAGTMKTCNEGDRTDPNDPCVITRIKQVQKIQEKLDGHYALGGDVDASATESWSGGAGFEPIGSQATNLFIGSLDGRGFEIRGLFIDRGSADEVGLFGFIDSGAEVSNLGLVDGSVHGHDYVGGLAGVSRGTISSSYNSSSVTGNEHVGGLVGSNYAAIEGVRNTGDVAGVYRIGGVAGANRDTIDNSVNDGVVTGDVQVGGIVGYSFNATVSSSSNSGPVTGTTENTGGVVGLNEHSVISDSSNDGPIDGNVSVGGIAGQNLREASELTESSTIIASHNSGSVTGDEAVGGVAGRNHFAEIKDSYSDVSGAVSGSKYVGGVAGWNSSGSIEDSYNAGAVTGLTGGSYTGGVAGFNYHGTIDRSHNSGRIDGAGIVGGIVGSNEQSGAVVTTSYNAGSVVGAFNVGGVAGSLWVSTIEDSYNLGSVTAATGRAGGVAGLVQGATSALQRTFNAGVVEGATEAGGLVGLHTGGALDDSYFDEEESPGMDDEATYGQSTAAMMQQSTYAPAWDFSTVWAIDDGNDYPDLIDNAR